MKHKHRKFLYTGKTVSAVTVILCDENWVVKSHHIEKKLGDVIAASQSSFKNELFLGKKFWLT